MNKIETLSLELSSQPNHIVLAYASYLATVVRQQLVSLYQTLLQGVLKKGLATPHSIRGWKENVLWFNVISLNQSAKRRTEPLQSRRARENSDWADSLASCLNLPCRDLRSSQQ